MVKRIFLITFSLCVVLPLFSQTWANFEIKDEERLSLETQRTPTFLEPCSEDKRSEDTLHYDGPNFHGMGLALPFYTGAVRFTPEVTGTLISIIFYHSEEATHNGDAYVYEKGTTICPGSIVRIEPYSVTDTGWYRINLSNSYPYNVGEDFWTGIYMDHTPGGHHTGVDSGPAVDGRGDWISTDSGATWIELQWLGFDYNWNIRAIVHLEGGGIEELRGKQQQKTRLEVYPNPFTKATNVQLISSNKNTSSNLTIYDASGRLVKSVKLETSTHQLGADLVPGIYFLKLNGKPTGKVVKVR